MFLLLIVPCLSELYVADQPIVSQLIQWLLRRISCTCMIHFVVPPQMFVSLVCNTWHRWNTISMCLKHQTLVISDNCMSVWNIKVYNTVLCSYSSDFYVVMPWSVLIVANISEECTVFIYRANYRCEFTPCVMHKINFWGALCN